MEASPLRLHAKSACELTRARLTLHYLQQDDLYGGDLYGDAGGEYEGGYGDDVQVEVSGKASSAREAGGAPSEVLRELVASRCRGCRQRSCWAVKRRAQACRQGKARISAGLQTSACSYTIELTHAPRLYVQRPLSRLTARTA